MPSLAVPTNGLGFSPQAMQKAQEAELARMLEAERKAIRLEALKAACQRAPDYATEEHIVNMAAYFENYIQKGRDG